MHGWSIRYFIIKFAPICKGGCRDYMRMEIWHSWRLRTSWLYH